MAIHVIPGAVWTRTRPQQLNECVRIFLNSQVRRRVVLELRLSESEGVGGELRREGGREGGSDSKDIR